MKCLNTALITFGMLAALACLTTSFSGYASEESELEKKTDALLKVDDYENALKLVEGFILENSEKPIGHAILAKVLAANGQTDEALKAYYQFYKRGETLSQELLLEVVRGALNHNDGLVRFYAAQALGKLRDNRAIPALINALNDDDGGVRWSAVFTLGKLGDKRAIPALIEIIGDGSQNIEIKFEVVKALVKLSRSTHK